MNTFAIYQKHFGKDDARTKESSEALKAILNQAVMLQKTLKDISEKGTINPTRVPKLDVDDKKILSNRDTDNIAIAFGVHLLFRNFGLTMLWGRVNSMGLYITHRHTASRTADEHKNVQIRRAPKQILTV